jgi:hypothetical protein
MSLLTDGQLSKNGAFKLRVQQAIAKAAIAIQAEDPGTTNHDNRIAWANNINTRHSLERQEERFMWRVVANSTISSSYAANEDQNDVSDNDIEFVVNGLIDTYANLDAPIV